MRARLFSGGLSIVMILTTSCTAKKSSHNDMLSLLKNQESAYHRHDNVYAPDAQVRYYDSLIKNTESYQDIMRYSFDKGRALVALGREAEAIELLEPQVERLDKEGILGMEKLKALLALAYLRDGERSNCIANHTGETCVLPIRGSGIHKIPSGSINAVRLYKELLAKNPDNLEYKWLLNIAHMTLGEYPDKVSEKFLLPDLDVEPAHRDDSLSVKSFVDIAGALGLNVNNMAGGSIIEDFNNDGYLDIVTSSWGLDEPMHYFENNKDGTFIDKSQVSKLAELTGGLNITQADFNNDGFKDILVLRGAWLRGDYCKQPNSLLRNNGDGTFTDITSRSGMLSFHPTQTATWNDFNNDGWVDVFIGNESWEGNVSSGIHPAELYLNNGDETFKEVATTAGCAIVGFVKGVTAGDYDNDGLKDIFATSLTGQRFLLRNKGIRDGVPTFEDVTTTSGLSKEGSRTFPTWFWDYNNDGWLDIFMGDFTFNMPISSYSASEALNISTGSSGACILYRNNHDGTFSDVSEETGLTKKAFAMGANFGDIDNDGFLDFYLGTGNPELESIVPNKLFRNVGGSRFEDITTMARVGHLQKGHAISFGDLDNDGDQDIYIEMGGAFKGDSFHNSLYLNPGQATRNRWIAIELDGKESNRNGIGARIKITVRENGSVRHIYRDVSSGGSFGSSPLRKEIGIGNVSVIDEIEIVWSPGGRQVFKNVQPGQFIRITQGFDTVEKIVVDRLVFRGKQHHNHSKSHAYSIKEISASLCKTKVVAR